MNPGRSRATPAVALLLATVAGACGSDRGDATGPETDPVLPPAPESVDAVGLDEAVFLLWDDGGRDEDFSHYRVYLEEDDGSVLLVGETDSEGFLDLLAENGITYAYFVTTVDRHGNEGDGSVLAEGTPRPDYHGELLHAHEDDPESAGFRFQESEEDPPVLDGGDPDRDFRLEADEEGWWLAPGPAARVHDAGWTSALRCGPAADFDCVDVREAPDDEAVYQEEPILLHPEHAYVLRVDDPEGTRHGLVRITHLGESQDGRLALFDWAFQLQPDNLELIRTGG